MHPEEDEASLLERLRLEHQRADLEVKIGHLEADVAYLRRDYLFLNEGAKKEAMFAAICGLDSEIQQLKTELASVNSQLLILRQFLESKRCVSVLICGVLFCSFLVQFCVACVLKFLRNFL